MPDGRAKRAHELITSLRNDGYSVGYGAATNDAFPDHVEHARESLYPEELLGYFLVTMREGTTDYESATVVEGSTAMALAQIQMLGAHFRAVKEATGLGTTDLIDAMVDEAITVDDAED